MSGSPLPSAPGDSRRGSAPSAAALRGSSPASLGSSGRSYERGVRSVLHGDAAATRKHHRLQHRLPDRRAPAAQPGTLRLHRVPDVHALPLRGAAAAAPAAAAGPAAGAARRTPPADPRAAERLLLQPGAGFDAGFDARFDAGHGAHLHPHGLAARRLLPVPAAPGGRQEVRLAGAAAGGGGREELPGRERVRAAGLPRRGRAAADFHRLVHAWVKAGSNNLKHFD